MIISFICWCIGMLILKDYGWEFKENLMYIMSIAGFMEFWVWVVIISFLLRGGV